MKSHCFAYVVFLAVLAKLSLAFSIQDLSGSTWTASNNNFSIRVASHVPGSIYTDLQKANVIGNIYDNFNDLKYRWVSYDNWTFTRHFDSSASFLQHDKIFLTCHGLDTLGQVFLNGHFLGGVENMFVRYKWPVKNLLREKNNLIQVKFFSAPEYAKLYYIKTLMSKYIIPPVCTPKQQSGECHVNFVRKMQSSFSWDWGPAFPTQGIWQPITLEAFNEITLRSITVDTQQDHTGQWLLNCTVFLESAASSRSNGNLSFYLNNTFLMKHEFKAQFDGKGEASISAFMLVPSKFQIKPWFPNGVGLQYLYSLTAKVVGAAGESTSKTIRIGFRTVKLIQKRLPSTEEAYSFYFEVNNLPIFSKGSNWIPAHVLHESYSEEYIRDLLISAKLANMNMLRVWGGGIYEDDRFYEIADEYGILIWQDMMFACALYPTDPQFLSSVQVEIRQQVRRLQHHPSIALWAGNNENEAAITGLWWPELALHMDQYRQDYRTLYINTIMPIVVAEDTSRPFLPSSPSNGIVSVRYGYISADPQSTRYGDVHFYWTWGNVWKWNIYPSAKFVSEYGFQSWSSLATLGKYISTSHIKYPLDEAFEHREHQENGLIYLNGMIKENLPFPSNGSAAKLADYIYISQIHQSMSIKIETEFYRRNRQVQPNGEGFTMGALYWQLNDIWPTVSWASVEFGGKWKMLHYYVRNMFDNLLIDAYENEENGGQISVVLIRDDHIQQSIPFRVTVEVFKWSGSRPALQHQVDSSTRPFSVTMAFQQSTDQLLRAAQCSNRNECFIQVRATGIFNGRPIERANFLLLGPIKNATGLLKAQIHASVIAGPESDSFGVNTFLLHLSTDHVAPFVYLDSSITGIFSDNGFLLTGPRNVTFRTVESVDKTKVITQLTVKSLKDVE